MILLTTPSARARECAEAIEAQTQQCTHVAESLQQALALLRDEAYEAVILDQCMLDTDPDQAEVVLQHTGTAILVTLNCAIVGTDRMVRELRSAIARRTKELQAARKAAEQSLRSDLGAPLTAILLDCELALNLPNLPPAGKDKLHSVHEMARAIQQRLHIEEPALTKQ